MSDKPLPLTPEQARFLERHLKAPPVVAGVPAAGLEGLAAALGFVVFAERRKRGDTTLEDMLEGALCREFLPWAAELSADEFGMLLDRYRAVLPKVATLEARLQEMQREEGLQEIDIDQSLPTWRADPTRPPDWFGDFVAYARASPPAEGLPAEELPAEELPDAVTAFLARSPAAVIEAPQPSAPAFNSDPQRRSKIVAPLEVMDADSRIALYGADNFDVNVQEDFAGTGGIRRISARRAEDDSIEVEIAGEILPGRLPRKPARKKGEPEPQLKPGQSWAPDLQAVSSWRKLKDIRLREPADWERLHLWGPGFGDEAAAGIYLGPRVVNQAYQNNGIETLIRQVGRLVAPLRAHGYRVQCTATVTTWPTPTPEGFAVEQVLRSVHYRVMLSYQKAGEIRTQEATAGLELLTDPHFVNEGFTPRIAMSADTAAWTALFACIPERMPDADPARAE